MGVRLAEFLGRFYIIPGARGTFRAKTAGGITNDDLTTQILIGSSSNGNYFANSNLTQTEKVMEFASFEDAYAVLGDGDMSDAIKACFPPSRDARFVGPQNIKAIVVNENDTASISAASNYVGVVHTISAAIPGPKGNALRFKFSTSGTVIAYGDATGIVTSQPIDADAFTIEYTGNGTSANIEINSTGLNTTLVGQTDGSLNLTLLWTAYPTLGDLINYISSQPGYSATLITSPDFLSVNLDHILVAESISILTPLTVEALYFSQVVILESNGLFKVTQGTSQKPFDDNVTFQYLTGGLTGTATTQDFLDALDFIKETKEQGFFMNVLTTNASVAARLADFAQFGNSPDGSREVFTGWGVDTTLSYDERLDLAKAVNSEYMVVGLVPWKMFRADGTTEKTFPGWMIAVIHNAQKASTNMRETPTYKDLNGIEAPEILSDPQIKKGIAAGGLVIDRKPNKGPFKITRAVTSYQKANLILNESSTVCTALAMVKHLREQLEANFLGEVPVDPDANNAALTDSDIRTFVDNLVRIDFIQRFGYLTRNVYTGEPAFDFNYTIKRDGDIIYFEFPDGKLVSPINFMFFLLNLDVVKGSSTGGTV